MTGGTTISKMNRLGLRTLREGEDKGELTECLGGVLKRD